MKKTVHIYLSLLTAWLMAAPTMAQTDSPGRSRLDMGRRPAAGALVRAVPGSSFRFLRYPPATGLDRSLTLRANLPINEYYRSLLLTRPATTAARPVASRPAATESASTSVSNEGRTASEESIRAEDRLFVSEQMVVSNIYPNPANDFAEIDYQLVSGNSEARIMLLDVLGSPVADFTLDRNAGKLRLNTRDLPTGYYFYQLSLDGRKVATKKLLVRHQ